MRSSTLVICILVLGSALSAELDLGTSLLSMDLSDIALLDTTSMSCSTPQNEFERVSAQMAAWADIVQHKDSLHRDIDRLEAIKELIQKRKFKSLEKQLNKLELPKTESKIGEPILAEFRQKLKGLSNPETADECEATLLKLCIYLLKQFNSCRQQCQSNPVTVIKIKGKIKDLQVVQQGCGQPAPCEDEPGLPDEPVPEIPDEKGPEEKEIPHEEEPTPPTPPGEEEKPEIPDEKGPEEKEIPHEEEPTPPTPPGEEEKPEIPDEKGPEEKEIPHEEEPTPPTPPGEEEKPEIPDEKGPEEKEIPNEEEPTPPTPPGEEEEEPEIPDEKGPEEKHEENEPPVEPPVEPSPEESPEEETEIPDEPPVNPNHEESPEETTEEWVEEIEEEFEEFEEPPIVVPPIEPPSAVEKTCLNSVNEIVYTSSVDEATPLVNKQLEGEDLSCYGFGFYTRWLQAYPTFLVHGRQSERYFVARVSESEHTTGEVNDNALSVYLTKEGLEFQSYDSQGLSTTVIQVGDIEGKWIYVYYSYCNEKAVAVVNEDGQTTINEINVSHEKPSQLYFQLAGQQGDVPSFQGQFRLVQANAGQNVFIGTETEANDFVFACNHLPEEKCERQISNLHDFEFHGADSQFDASSVVENTEPIYAQEYSVSGWFKWYPVQNPESWYSAFRLTLNNLAVNQNAKQLGDRDLALFVGSEKKDSVLAFTTYTYSDLYGNGNPTYWQAIPYEKDLVHWHYIYFGYNRHISKAYGYVEFFTRKGEVHFENVKHFDAPHKYLYVGQDQFYKSYSGKIFNLHYNLCDGSYRELKYDEHWGYTPKPTDPVPPPPVPVIPSEPASEEEWVEPPIPPIPSEPEEDIPYEPEEENPLPPPSLSEEETPEETPVEPPVEPPVESEEETPEETPEIPDEPVPDPDHEEEPELPEDEPSVPEEDVEPPVEPPVESEEEPSIPEEEEPSIPEEEEPQPPAPVPQPKCPPTIEVNKDNAADILCELSHYLGEFAQGHVPVAGPSTKTVCFCMTYNEDYAPPTLLQLASKIPGHIQMNEPKVAVPLLKKFIKQRQ
ncbi:unnamed protein product [Paramecium pentaurelia]|uniref:Uncharacterized protein n=1 Tax=Paramecium pentaurelia TaxID=43138 RepID=A0A8S1XZR5_9CILI|nr:unnamed protein product [Paramecium pentaurelia]